MELSMRMLSERLGSYHLELHLSWDDKPALVNVKYLGQDRKAQMPEYVYVAKAEDISEALSMRDGVSIVSIGRNAGVERLCGQPANSVVILDEECDLFAVFDTLQSCFQFYNQWERELQECVVKGSGLQELIDLGDRVFGNPIFLLDSAFMALAWSKDIRADSADDNWRSIAVEGHSNAEFIRSAKNSELLNYHNSLIEPTFVPGPRRAILHNIRSGSITVARVCVEEVGTTLTDSHRYLLKLLSKFILTTLQRDLGFQKTQGSIYDFFIIEQLDGKMHDEQLIRGYLCFQGWKESDSFCVMVFQESNTDTGNNTLEYYGNLLKGMFYGSRSYIYEKNIVLIINEHRIKFLGADSYQALKQFLRTNNLLCGISGSFSNFSNLHEHFQQASTALRLGTCFMAEELLHDYKDYAIFHIIENCSKTMNLEQLCHPAVMKLYMYDREFHTDYFNSLNTYLLVNKKLSDASVRLGIHRNTAAYRLERIASITGLNLENESETLYLLFSCRIIEYMKKFVSEERAGHGL